MAFEREDLLSLVARCTRNGTFNDLPDDDAFKVLVHNWRIRHEECIDALNALVADPDEVDAIHARLNAQLAHDGRWARWNGQRNTLRRQADAFLEAAGYAVPRAKWSR